MKKHSFKKLSLVKGRLTVAALLLSVAGVATVQAASDNDEQSSRRADFEERRVERLDEIRAENPALADEMETLHARREQERDAFRAEFPEMAKQMESREGGKKGFAGRRSFDGHGSRRAYGSREYHGEKRRG